MVSGLGVTVYKNEGLMPGAELELLELFIAAAAAEWVKEVMGNMRDEDVPAVMLVAEGERYELVAPLKLPNEYK